jgi:hypothetical protein
MKFSGKYMLTEELTEIILALCIGRVWYKVLKFGNLDGRPQSPVLFFLKAIYCMHHYSVILHAFIFTMLLIAI